MRDYLVIAFLGGVTSMRRRLEADWKTAQMNPGDVSMLTRAAQSHWTWTDNIDVLHVYLTQEQLDATCREMYERDVDGVELVDELRTDSPEIHRTVVQLAREASADDAGSGLLVDALGCQLTVEIIRRYAHVRYRETARAQGLTLSEQREVRAYIDEHLSEPISLEQLAQLVFRSRYHFSRLFRLSTGFTPHQFVIQQRLERAKSLLRRTNKSLQEIGYLCGFADQSHMTRLFNQRLNTTPAAFRGWR